MAQMELIINYLDALIKKKTLLWIYEGLLGGKDKKPLVILSFEWKWGLGRSRKGGYRIIFQEGLQPKGLFEGGGVYSGKKWKGIQENRIPGPAKCFKGQGI